LADLAAQSRSWQLAVDGSLRLARIATDAAEVLREHPDSRVRRAAAVLAAQAHPLLAAEAT
jgi:hypothetical protein